jgi:hypothetical protein
MSSTAVMNIVNGLLFHLSGYSKTFQVTITGIWHDKNINMAISNVQLVMLKMHIMEFVRF